MKKLLIALGALTVASSAMALESFSPTGTMKQEIRWYGDKAGDVDVPGFSDDNEGIRFTLAEGGIKFTDKFYIDYRVRKYLEYKGDEDFSDNTEARSRFYYEHGYLGNTRISARQRFEVVVDEDANRFTYSPEFRFRDYIPENNFIQADVLTIRPNARYQDDAGNGDGDPHNNYKQVGLDFLSVWSLKNLPEKLDFAFEFNVYNTYFDQDDYYTNHSVGDIVNDDDTDDGSYSLAVEFYTYLTYDLFNWKGIDFAFYHEFGLDPFTYYGDTVNEVDGNVVTDEFDTSANIYNDFELQFSYPVNTSTSIYGAVAMEHANQMSNDDIGDFTWQPYAYVGWKTVF